MTDIFLSSFDPEPVTPQAAYIPITVLCTGSGLNEHVPVLPGEPVSGGSKKKVRPPMAFFVEKRSVQHGLERSSCRQPEFYVSLSLFLNMFT
jgi:hypothetical protein